jgi:long-chain acyl-CoA synthetase
MQESIPKLLKEIVNMNADRTIQWSKDESGVFQPTSYLDFLHITETFAGGLHSLGVRHGDHVGLISDNRREWLIADQAILGLGAADVPRGCDSMAKEIHYILGFSGCKLTIAENYKQVEKIIAGLDEMPKLKAIIVIDPSDEPVRNGLFSRVKIVTFGEVMKKGEIVLSKNPGFFDEQVENVNGDDIATIIFTSGTTGVPKGVMLTHQNFLFQMETLPVVLELRQGEIFLSVLPVWHSFERIIQYMVLAIAAAVAYSKPVGQIMMADFQAVKPTWMGSVPRIWEAIMQGIYRSVNEKGVVVEMLFRFFVAVGGAHSTLTLMLRGLMPQFKRRVRVFDIVVAAIPYLLLAPLRLLGDVLVFRSIKEKLGGRFVAAVSGGGALPPAVDKFFAAAGILLLEGYGLTETAPVLAIRPRRRPVPNTVGPPLPGTMVRIVDDEGKVLSYGKKGLVLAKGGQIMPGYYNNDAATRRILSEDGWLNTGDLGMLTRKGELRLMGRAKDTIVLLGGENIEPLPMEHKLKESSFIKEAVVLGQDKKYLAAIIVPDRDRLEDYAKENGIPYIDARNLVTLPEVYELIDSEINQLISAKNEFKTFERIFRFKLIDHDFELNRELSAKQEIKRYVLGELYKKEIEALFADRT